MSRLLSLRGLLPALLMIAGCGTGFQRGTLDPKPAGTSDDVHAQLREIATADRARLLFMDPKVNFAASVDLHNRGAGARVVDLAHALFRFDEAPCGSWVLISPIAGGEGDLPERVQLSEHQLPSITLAPNQQRTVWLVFVGVSAERICRWHSLLLRVQDAGEIVLALVDPQARTINFRQRPRQRHTHFAVAANARQFIGVDTQAVFYPNPFGCRSPTTAASSGPH